MESAAEARGHTEGSRAVFTAPTACFPIGSAPLTYVRIHSGTRCGLAAWQRVVELRPDAPAPRLALAEAWRRMGYWGEMVAELDASLRLNPDDHVTCAYLAWTLATAPTEGVRDGAKAVRLAQRALKVGESADRLDTFGAALAEAGRHQEAVAAIERALALLPSDAAELRSEYETRLALYRSGRPFHHR